MIALSRPRRFRTVPLAAAVAVAILALAAPDPGRAARAKPPYCGETNDQGEPLWESVDGPESIDERDPIEGPLFRVWYPVKKRDSYRPSALAFAAALEEAWPKLIDVMDTKPLSDAASECSNGGGGLDVFLSDDGEEGSTLRFHDIEDCKGVASWIELGAGLQGDDPSLDFAARMKVRAAHELMHVLQFTVDLTGDCIDYDLTNYWWSEASAVWAQDYVLGRQHNEEHQYATEYFDNLHVSLDYAGLLQGRDRLWGYASYLYPFWLTHRFGDPQLVGEIWKTLSAASGSGIHEAVEAADATVDGGFEETFPEFAVANLNEPAFTDYELWDGISDGAYEYPTWQGSAVVGATTFLPDPQIPHLASRVYRIRPAPDVTLLQVDNGWHGLERVRLQAALRPPDGGALERPAIDWTDRPHEQFCFDDRSERISELVLVASNSHMESEKIPAHAPSVKGWAVPCKRLRGTTRSVWKQTISAMTTQWTIEAEGVADVTFLVADRGENELLFRVESGTVTWTKSSRVVDTSQGIDYTCGTQPVVEDIAPDDGHVVIRLPGAPGVSGPAYAGTGITTVGQTTYECPGTPIPPRIIPHDQASWFDTGGDYFSVGAGGRLEGQAHGDQPLPFGKQEWWFEWALGSMPDP